MADAAAGFKALADENRMLLLRLLLLLRGCCVRGGWPGSWASPRRGSLSI